MKSDLMDIEVYMVAETDRAILVSETGDKEDAVWLPKSQIEFESCERGESLTVTLPEWLAKDKGLI